jgi:hypothetical protein
LYTEYENTEDEFAALLPNDSGFFLPDTLDSESSNSFNFVESIFDDTSELPHKILAI